MNTDIIMTLTINLGGDTTMARVVTIHELSKIAYAEHCDLLEALHYAVTDLEERTLEEIYIKYEGEQYPFPDATRYEGSSLSIERWETLLTDMEYMLDTLNSKYMPEPRAYLNMCLHKEEVLTVKQFDSTYGGQAPNDTSSYVEYAKELVADGVIEVPDDLYNYIDWASLGKDITKGAEITEPDIYTGEQWFVN